MMRKLVLLLAILALPGLAMAQPAMDAISPDDGGAIDQDGIVGQVTVNQGQAVVVDVSLAGATTVTAGLQYSLTADGGVSDNLMTVVGYARTEAALFPIGGLAANPAPAFPINLGVNNAVAEGYMAFAPYAGPPIASWVITCATVGTYLIQSDTLLYGSNGVDGMPFAGAGIPLVLKVVPEPATLSLLLLGLPFLRRRR
jgi:hypothetical protein